MIRFITSEKLRLITSTRGLHIGRVLYRLHRHYCRKMDTRGKCDLVCNTTCKVSLTRIFRPFENPKDPYALVVWRCREALAVQVEETSQAVPQVNIFNEQVIGNAFEWLAEEYDESEAEAN